MKKSMTPKKVKKINNRFFKDDKLEIGRLIISELETWEDAKKPTAEEFYRLVDRLYGLKVSLKSKIK